jgi:hypothetical protein
VIGEGGGWEREVTQFGALCLNAEEEKNAKADKATIFDKRAEPVKSQDGRT